MKVHVKKLLAVTTVVTLLPMFAVAGDLNGDGWVTVLLPIGLTIGQQIPGANGTRWGGQVWVQNASAVGFYSLQPKPGACQFDPCPPPYYRPGFIGQVSGVANNHVTGGALFYLRADIADQIHLSARILELAYRSQPTGVDLPLPREGDFFTGETWYLGVPVGTGVRSTLRAYDPLLSPDSALQVDMFAPDGTLITTTILRPGADPITSIPRPTGALADYPSAAEITDISTAFPQLLKYDTVHIRLTPLSAGMQYWAVVSVTHNDTQHVLLITANR